MYRFLLFIFIHFIVLSNTFAQYDTVHYIPPVAYSYWNNKTEIVVSTSSSQSANVHVFKSDGTHLFDTIVVKGNPIRHVLENSNPSQELLLNNSLLISEGLVVKSNLPVSVNVRDIANNSFGTQIKGNYSMNSKGYSALGSSFHLIGYRSTNLIYGILAIEDNTTVLVSNVGNQSIQLNKGESYLINSNGLGNNIGVLIKSNKNISITSSASFESPGGCGDAISEQLIPNELAGTEYLVVKGRGTSTLEQFTVVAIEPNTSFTAGGIAYNLANSGDFITLSNGLNIHDYQFVKADKPILVAQGSGLSCEADQTILPPLNCTGSKVIETKDFLGLNYEVYVLTHPQNVPKLNGVPLTNPIIVNSIWVLYIFNQAQVTGDSILLESNSMMQCAILQSGSGFSMFGYFSGFTKPNTVKIRVESSTNTNELIEGCESAMIIIERDDASTEEYVNISFSGSAQNVIDYEEIISRDTLKVNQFSDTLFIKTKFDSSKEGPETLVISFDYIDHCSGETKHFDSTLVIKDYLKMTYSGNDSINFCSENETEVNLSAIVSNGIQPYTYFWDNSTNTLNYQTIYTNQIFPNQNLYTLTATDACKQVLSIPFSIYNQCEVAPSNVITANNDGVNDFFLVQHIEDYNQVELQVIDRWGSIVYQNKKYDNSFCGKNSSGHELTSGVYFYRIIVDSSKYEYSKSKKESNVLTGFLQIIR